MINIPFKSADILLPKNNFESWSVIACDQFTSRPDYWNSAKTIAGDNPSTLNLIFPEVFLGKVDYDSTIQKINRKMDTYLQSDIYDTFENALILVERTQPNGKIRYGIMGTLDLEYYDYSYGSKSLIRATEKTAVDRIPPRVKIRENASTEIPHVMTLIDDPQKTVIEPLADFISQDKLKKLYDFDLMLGGGHLRGFLIPQELHKGIFDTMANLYRGEDSILFAVGDGNHSLAAAKTCYMQNPTPINRFALTEIVNLHSDALEFEPIFRTVENVDRNSFIDGFLKFLENNGAEYSVNYTDNENFSQKVTFVGENGDLCVSIKNPVHSIDVGTIQTYLDEFSRNAPDAVIDYIHGEDEVRKIAKNSSSVGILYSSIEKSQLFDVVEKEQVLPKKTFSMGVARDKRYYTEVRKIR